MRRFMAIGLFILLGACTRPADGPSEANILNGVQPNSNEKIPVIDLAQAPIGDALATAPNRVPADPGLLKLRAAAYTGSTIRRGDTIEVTIFDTGEDALFASANSKTLNLGRFTVNEAGSVDMPFVGKLHVLGQTPETVQSNIVAGLKGKAVNPQTVVKITDSPTSAVSVSGGVHQAGRVALDGGRERILDVIARAGGASGQPKDTVVTLIRGSRRVQAPLDRIMSDPKQNVYVQPDDQIIVGGLEPSFTAFGAFKSVGEFKFEPGQMTLAQALGRTGGLLDDRADPENMYLIRKQGFYFDPIPLQQPQAAASSTTAPGPRAIIYRVNLKDVSNFVLMQQFQVQDGDILFATNASMVDWAKLLTVFQKSVPTAAAPLPSAPSQPSPPSLPSVPSVPSLPAAASIPSTL